MIQRKKLRRQLVDESSRGAPRHRPQLLIKCKDARYNHYDGQAYRVWSLDRLASYNWKQPHRSLGDHFTVLGGAPLAAWEPSERLELPPSFAATGLVSAQLCAALEAEGVVRPTVIQVLGLEPIRDGWNTLLAAETGCGKTLAYLAPLLDALLYRQQHVDLAAPEVEHVAVQEDDTEEIIEGEDVRTLGDALHVLRRDCACAVIAAPSAELCAQILGVAERICAPLGLRAALASGQPSAEAEQLPADLLVGTPGALLTEDRVGGRLQLHRLRAIVLDEADTLLDDSFMAQSRRLLRRARVQSSPPAGARLPAGCQLLMAAATLPASLEEGLGASGADLQESLRVACSEALHRLSGAVRHRFVRSSDEPAPTSSSQDDEPDASSGAGDSHRLTLLLSTLRRHRRNRGAERRAVVVFCSSNGTAAWLDEVLRRRQVPHAALYGRQPVAERAAELARFQDGAVPVLLATDLASRGLDTSRATHVINYEFPRLLSDYLHRAGRVGRVGSDPTRGCPSGQEVLSFVSRRADVELLWRIESAVRQASGRPAEPTLGRAGLDTLAGRLAHAEDGEAEAPPRDVVFGEGDGEDHVVAY